MRKASLRFIFSAGCIGLFLGIFYAQADLPSSEDPQQRKQLEAQYIVSNLPKSDIDSISKTSSFMAKTRKTFHHTVTHHTLVSVPRAGRILLATFAEKYGDSITANEWKKVTFSLSIPSNTSTTMRKNIRTALDTTVGVIHNFINLRQNSLKVTATESQFSAILTSLNVDGGDQNLYITQMTRPLGIRTSTQQVLDYYNVHPYYAIKAINHIKINNR